MESIVPVCVNSSHGIAAFFTHNRTVTIERHPEDHETPFWTVAYINEPLEITDIIATDSLQTIWKWANHLFRRVRRDCIIADSNLFHSSTPCFIPHTQDSHCSVNPETDCCFLCGVDHSGSCPDCAGRGFHKDTCPQMAGF